MDKVRYKVREVLDKNKIETFCSKLALGIWVWLMVICRMLSHLILCGQMECFISMEPLVGDEIK